MTIPKASILAAFAGALLLGACDSGPQDSPAAAIRAEDLSAVIATLASDEYAGRGPSGPGGEKTVGFIEQKFKSLGLAPAFGGSYRQDVGLVESTVQPSSQLSVVTPDGERILERGPQTVFWTKRVQERVTVQASDLVFVGYGAVAPEYGWNDYEGVDVKGKTVVILINDPGFATEDPALFNGKAMTYYGRWTYKYEEAARQGAAAAIIVHETAPAAYPWEVVENSWTIPQIDLVRADKGMSRAALEGWITHEAAEALFTSVGQDYAALKEAAKTPGFRAVPLAGLQLNATIDSALRDFSSQNVGGVVHGAGAPDEYVIYMAHWDHLGVDNELTAGQDQVFNGAVDNATGVAAILDIAEAFALGPPPRRSVMFVAVTAEESGLLGSAYFAEHPPVPPRQMAAGINFDALNVMGEAKDVTVIGYGASELEDILKEEAAKDGRYLSPDPRPEWGFFYRSDHVNLAKAGVPVIYARPGVDLVEGGAETGRAVMDDYTANRYHKTSDEYSPTWDMSGIVEHVNLFLRFGRRIADSDSWPNWYEGNEFRALREAQRAGG